MKKIPGSTHWPVLDPNCIRTACADPEGEGVAQGGGGGGGEVL